MSLELYALGSNGSGQLGIGHEDDTSKPVKCALPPSFTDPDHPLRIVAGGNHSLLTSSDHDIYTAGVASDGRCGDAEAYGPRLEAGGNLTSFHKLGGSSLQSDTPMKYSLCSATWEASALVSVDGKSVYTCGTGRRGELGQGPTVQNSPRPIRVLDLTSSDAHVTRISSCMSHTVVVLSNGDVWGWGSGRKGQLGSPNEDCWAPRMIEGIPFEAVDAVCGKEYSYVVSSPEDGRHVILGADKWNIRSTAPAAVKSWKQIGSSWGSIYVLIESGELIGWGRNDHGQLPAAGLPRIEKFAAGSEHAVAITSDNRTLAWGWGEHGNCGEPTGPDGDVSGKWNELEVSGTVRDVWCGCATTWICTEESP